MIARSLLAGFGLWMSVLFVLPGFAVPHPDDLSAELPLIFEYFKSGILVFPEADRRRVDGVAPDCRH